MDNIVVVNLGNVVAFINESEVAAVIEVAVTIDNDVVRWASNVALVANDVVDLAFVTLLNDWLGLVVVAEINLVRVVVLIN